MSKELYGKFIGLRNEYGHNYKDLLDIYNTIINYNKFEEKIKDNQEMIKQYHIDVYAAQDILIQLTNSLKEKDICVTFDHETKQLKTNKITEITRDNIPKTSIKCKQSHSYIYH